MNVNVPGGTTFSQLSALSPAFNSPKFKNQGDCVSWFATKGKNKPGKNM